MVVIVKNKVPRFFMVHGVYTISLHQTQHVVCSVSTGRTKKEKFSAVSEKMIGTKQCL